MDSSDASTQPAVRVEIPDYTDRHVPDKIRSNSAFLERPGNGNGTLVGMSIRGLCHTAKGAPASARIHQGNLCLAFCPFRRFYHRHNARFQRWGQARPGIYQVGQVGGQFGLVDWRCAGICAALPRNMRFSRSFWGVFASGSAQTHETPENSVKSLIFRGFLLRQRFQQIRISSQTLPEDPTRFIILFIIPCSVCGQLAAAVCPRAVSTGWVCLAPIPLRNLSRCFRETYAGTGASMPQVWSGVRRLSTASDIRRRVFGRRRITLGQEIRLFMLHLGMARA